MVKLLAGGLISLILLLPALSPISIAKADSPTGEDLKEITLLSKELGSRDNLFDVPEEIRPLISASAVKYEVPEAILTGLLKKESNFRNVLGTDGSGRGIAQIDSYWHPEVSDSDAFNPAFAVAWASKYLSDLKTTFGSWYNALRAYNGGSQYASWRTGYGGLPVSIITASYANTIYSFAQEYATKGSVESIPDIPEDAQITKSISGKLVEDKDSTEKVSLEEVNKYLEEAKTKSCDITSCRLPNEFGSINIAEIQTDKLKLTL